MPISVKCNSCGHAGRVADHLAGKLLKCPKCGQTFQVGGAVPPGQGPARPATPNVPVPLARPAPNDEDDGDPYGLAPAGASSSTGRACPECGATMAPQAVVCTSCGLDTRSGRKYEREEPAPAPVRRESRSERARSSSSEEGGMNQIVWYVLIFGVGNAILYYFTGWVIIPIRR